MVFLRLGKRTEGADDVASVAALLPWARQLWQTWIGAWLDDERMG